VVPSTTAGSPTVGRGDCTTGEGGVLLSADSAGSAVVSDGDCMVRGGGSAASTAVRLPADRGGCAFRGTGTEVVLPTAANERQGVKSGSMVQTAQGKLTCYPQCIPNCKLLALKAPYYLNQVDVRKSRGVRHACL